MRHGKTRPRSGRSLFIGVLVLVVSFQTSTPAWAWGRLGHRVISKLADKNLTPKAKAAIAALLDDGESIADASTWADEHRGRLPKTAPWHYVDVPLDEPRYDSKFSGDVSTKGCIVDKIHEFQATLKDPARSVEQRQGRGLGDREPAGGLLAARQAYQVPETGKRLTPGQRLADSYQEANLPVVRRRLYQASVRLVLVLNEAFPEPRRRRERRSSPTGHEFTPDSASVVANWLELPETIRAGILAMVKAPTPQPWVIE